MVGDKVFSVAMDTSSAQRLFLVLLVDAFVYRSREQTGSTRERMKQYEGIILLYEQDQYCGACGAHYIR